MVSDITTFIGVVGIVIKCVKFLQSKLQYINKRINDLSNLTNRALSALAKANIRNDITKQREKKEANKIISKLNYFESLNKRNFIIKLILVRKADLDDFGVYLQEVIFKREFDML